MRRGLAITVPAALAATALVAGGCRHESEQTLAQPAVADLDVAPASERVDLAAPAFSAPTEVDTPLFPVSQPAQDDDGAVWYFGEDVFNFKDGVIADTHGTWIAGKDGPAAVIMPADPKVGDVYRPENIPGFVFEEVTVKAVDQTLEGPLGPVEGGLVIEELHMDSTTEDKTFAPGYGEFLTGGGGDVEALALAVPTDALSGSTPADVARWSLDLQLRHRPVVEIDLARFDLWLAQVLVDAAAGDPAAVNGDFFALDYIRDRVQHTLNEADRSRLNAGLEELNGSVADEDLAGAADAAEQLREAVAEFAAAS